MHSALCVRLYRIPTHELNVSSVQYTCYASWIVDASIWSNIFIANVPKHSIDWDDCNLAISINYCIYVEIALNLNSADVVDNSKQHSASSTTIYIHICISTMLSVKLSDASYSNIHSIHSRYEVGIVKMRTKKNEGKIIITIMHSKRSIFILVILNFV